MRPGPSSHPRVPGKRAFDLTVSGALLVVLSPVMAVVAAVVRLTSRGPALHRASRIGHGGDPFTMYKFRSMYVESELPALTAGSLTTGLNDPRVTPVGQVLRKYKLDELPQLWNVVRGDMSLVGPRPEVAECVALYTPEQQDILGVRPGLTDLASLEFVDLAGVVGESENPHAVYMDQVFDAKNALRLQYVRRASWRLDLSILARTATSVLRIRRGR